MALQIPPGYALVFHALFHGSASRQWGVTMGYDISESTADNVDTITEIDQSFRASWSAQIDNSIQFMPARAQIGNDGPPLSAVSTEAPALATRTSVSPPPNVAVGITKRTMFGGRQYRGRNFFPGLLQTGEVDELGVISTGRITSLQNAANAWLSGLQGSVLQPWPVPPVLLHGPTQFGGPIPAPTPITSLEAQRRVRTQRRRLRS